MKLTYKVVMFLTLLIFCAGNVCAVDTDLNNDSFIKDGISLKSFASIYMDDLNLNTYNKNNDYFIYDLNGDCLGHNVPFDGNVDSKKEISDFSNDTNKYNPNINNTELSLKVNKVIGGKTGDKMKFLLDKQNLTKSSINRINNMSVDIVHKLNNIDHEINKTLNFHFSDLTKKINVLKSKNSSKVIDNILKSNNKSLICVNGYSNTVKSYLYQITEYLKLKESLKDDINIDNKSFVDIDNDIIESLNIKIKCLESLKHQLNDVKKKLNILKNVVKL